MIEVVNEMQRIFFLFWSLKILSFFKFYFLKLSLVDIRFYNLF